MNIIVEDLYGLGEPKKLYCYVARNNNGKIEVSDEVPKERFRELEEAFSFPIDSLRYITAEYSYLIGTSFYADIEKLRRYLVEPMERQIAKEKFLDSLKANNIDVGSIIQVSTKRGNFEGLLSEITKDYIVIIDKNDDLRYSPINKLYLYNCRLLAVLDTTDTPLTRKNVIKYNPKIVLCWDDASEDEFKLALDLNPEIISRLENPSKECQLIAFNKNKMLLKYCKDLVDDNEIRKSYFRSPSYSLEYYKVIKPTTSADWFNLLTVHPEYINKCPMHLLTDEFYKDLVSVNSGLLTLLPAHLITRDVLESVIQTMKATKVSTLKDLCDQNKNSDSTVAKMNLF